MLNLSLYRLSEFPPAVWGNSEEIVPVIYGSVEKMTTNWLCNISCEITFI